MIAAARALLKFAGFLGISARALCDYNFNVRPRGETVALQAQWSQRWGRRFSSLLGVELTVHGTPPAAGMLACNHLSYLDIVVLAAIRPQVFLSKAEVRNWPLIGALTRCAGTLFIRRDRKSDVAELQQAFSEVIAQDVTITIFPEGTSSDGARVLPFYSSLLEPAAQHNWPVTPAWIGYRLDDGEGSAAEDVCYWRDMTFGPHFLKLLSKKRIHATIAFGEPLPAGLTRKKMAAALHEEVCALARSRQPWNAATSTSAPSERLVPVSAR
jgi:1-acyl-sn-glycerol-3-phosphate acyltransferase